MQVYTRRQQLQHATMPGGQIAHCMTRMAPAGRRHVSKLLILDGREKLEMWWVEEGYLTDLSSVLLVSPFIAVSLS